MFNPFQLFDRIIKWYSEGISRKARILIALFILFFFGGVGFAGYKINNYFEKEPEACRLCYVHDYAHDLWAQSKHNVVPCKDAIMQLKRNR